MGIDVELKRKITVNGQDYESLDQVPEEFRSTVQNALASGTAPKMTININGKTYSSVEELPAVLRTIIGGLTSLAMKPEAEAVRAEPVLSMKMVVVAIGLAAMLYWLARLVF